MHPKVAIGPWIVSTYVLAHVVYFCVVPFVAASVNRRLGIPRRLTWTAFAIGAPAGIFGAHLLAMIENPQLYREHPELLTAAIGGGSAILGGFLAAVAVVAAFTAWYGVSFRRFLDGCTPAMALGEAVTRVGCFLAGCCYGVPTASRLGVPFPRESPVFAGQVQQGLIDFYDAHASLPVHPTQLYAALFALAALVAVAILLRRGARDGVPFAVFFCGYGLFRLALFTLRADPGPTLALGLASSQLASTATIVIGIAIAWPRRRRAQRVLVRSSRIAA
jgi:phosphatidylglycerol:prolipoprotein diacylglycerol transferase